MVTDRLNPNQIFKKFNGTKRLFIKENLVDNEVTSSRFRIPGQVQLYEQHITQTQISNCSCNKEFDAYDNITKDVGCQVKSNCTSNAHHEC